MLNKKMNLSKNALVVLLLALFTVLPIIGMLFSSGHHLLAFSIINKHEEWNGVPFIAPWSDVYRESDKQYSTYLWGDEKRKVQLYLPQLDESVIHKEIRGIGKVSWLVEQDGRYKSSDAGINGVRNVPVESFFYFRLLPDQTRDGTLYYTSEKGSASIISFQEPAREPLDLEVVLSANGKNLFLLRYPSRFPATGLLTVSPDGNYVTPDPSSMNTGDFTYFWFSETVGTEDFLNMLQGKNQSIRFYNKEFPIQLITALQEADGAMITRILERADDMGVTVDAPEMTANEWTSFLRRQYDGLDYQELIRYLNLVGEQFTYVWEEQASSESYREYQIRIPFPHEKEITVVEVRSEARELVEIRVILDEGE